MQNKTILIIEDNELNMKLVRSMLQLGKYLDFAEHIVAMSDNNPGLRLMDAMLNHETVVKPGEGKGYQLMANLLGYLRLYRCTGNEKYLQTVVNGWEEINEKHKLVTGGPWTRKMPYNGNMECFAHTEDFNPEKVVVSQLEGEQTTILELKVAQEDLGKVIGKQGRTARAIRVILGAAGMKEKRRYNLEIIEKA